MQMVTEYSEKQMHEIGARIKFARRARGLNQGQLCDRARIPSIKIVSKYELGLDIPRGERLTLICKALGVTEHYILEGETMAMSVSETVKKPQLVTAIQPVETKEPDGVEESAKPEEPKKKAFSYVDKRTTYVWPNCEKLKELRMKHKLSQADVALLCGIEAKSKTGLKSTISLWETGRSRIAPSHLRILSEYYSVPYDELVDAERTKNNPVTIAVGNLYNTPAMKKHREKLEAEQQKEEVTMVKEPETKPEPAPIQHVQNIPERAEDYFCKNVKYYVNKREIKDEVFEDACGCDIGFMDEVIRHSYKIPLTVTLKIARLLDMSIEELVSDTSAMEIEKEIAEYEAKIRELRKQMGMK